MARILCDQRVVEYSVEFKLKVIDLTEKLSVTSVQIAAAPNVKVRQFVS